MPAHVLSFPSNPQNFAACRDGLRYAAKRYGATMEQQRAALSYAFLLMRQGRTAAYAVAEAGRILRGGRIVVAQPTPPTAA